MNFFVAMLLSIAVMTCTYVHHVRNLRSMNRLIYNAHNVGLFIFTIVFEIQEKKYRRALASDPTVL